MGAFIPEALKSAKKWILHDEKKQPFSGKAFNNRIINPTDAREWTSYGEALQKLENTDFAGLGFVLSDDDNIICIDLDGCINENGDISDFAAAIVSSFSDTYIEISRSGRGLHIFCFGDIPRSFRNDGVKLEIYKNKRYIAITGEPWEACKELANKGAEVMALYTLYAKTGAEIEPPELQKQTPATRSDKDIIERAEKGANGAQFRALWAGEWQERYKTQSNADMRLIALLWYYSGNAEQVARLFLMSGLADRKKAQRADYIQRTIEAAARNTPTIDQQTRSRSEPQSKPTDQPQRKKYKRF